MFHRWGRRANLENEQKRERDDGFGVADTDTSKPRFLTPDGKPCWGAEEDYHFAVFEYFRDFGDFFNSWRQSTAFRLLELQDTAVTYRKGDLDLGANYGHRYNVCYQQRRIGLLQISASRIQYSKKDGLVFSETVKQAVDLKVAVDILLDPFFTVPVPFKEVREFLENIVRYTTSEDKECNYTGYDGVSERRYALETVGVAMQEALWNGKTITTESGGPSLHLFYFGAPTEWYRQISNQTTSVT